MAHPHDLVLKRATATFLAQLAGAASTAAIGLYVARRLGIELFGVYGVAVAMVMLLAPIVDLGVSLSASRQVARSSPTVRAQLILDGVLLKAGTTLVAAAALYIAAKPV